MIPAFDIFQVQPTGIQWLGTATTPADAVRIVQELFVRSRIDYLIFHQETGSKFTIKHPGATAHQSAEEFADVFKTFDLGR